MACDKNQYVKFILNCRISITKGVKCFSTGQFHPVINFGSILLIYFYFFAFVFYLYLNNFSPPLLLLSQCNPVQFVNW